MKRILLTLISLVLLGLFFIASAGDNGRVIDSKNLAKTLPALKKQAAGPGARMKLDTGFGNLPLYFTENKGQVNKTAKFYAKTSKYKLWLTKEGLVFDSIRIQESGARSQDKNKTPGNPPFCKKVGPKTFPEAPSGHLERTHQSPFTSHPSPPSKYEREVTRLLFSGANPNPSIVPLDKTNHKRNYFIGNDTSKWQTDVPTFRGVIYKNIYRNIDLKVFGKGNRIEYDWIVKPDGNPAVVRFVYMGAKSTYINEKGDLVIETEFGKLLHKKPESYQVTTIKGKDSCVPVDVTFKKFGKHTFGFSTGKYDKSGPLIIDPLIRAYATYLGGSNEDFCGGMAVDGSGNAFLTGHTYSDDFPTVNGYQSDQSKIDIFVTKINANGTVAWSTYLGGGGDDYGRGTAVDTAGDVYVTGETGSTNFPTTANAFDNTNPPSTDAFVTRIDSTGSSLVYSSYLGSIAQDEGQAIAVDKSTNNYVYITGYSKGHSFPFKNGYHDYQSENDVFLTKINTNLSGTNSLIYSTYLGGIGNGNETGYAVAVEDTSGMAYMTGLTNSTNFPGCGASSCQGTRGGGYDVFIAKIDTTLSGTASLIYSTYLGGGGDDEGKGVATDGSGNVYVTGITRSADFPTDANSYQELDQPGLDAFLAKINTTVSGSTGLIYSTYLGGGGTDEGYGIALDGDGRAMVTGITYSSNFPKLNSYKDYGSNGDAFITIMGIDALGNDTLEYSTFLGGSDVDKGCAVAGDSSQNIYVAGHTQSLDFPTSPDAYQGVKNNARDIFFARLRPGNLMVTDPNGGENLSAGTDFYITWEGGSVIEGNLDIKLYRDDEYYCDIVSGIPPTYDGGDGPGSYKWEVGLCISGSAPAGTSYKIKINDVGETVSDMSDDSFEISSGIAISQPDGTSWPFELNREIKFSAPAGNYKITLRKNGSFFGTIYESVFHDGIGEKSCIWKVGECVETGTTAQPGPGYTVRVEEIGQPVSAESAEFNISGINITRPVGGEKWEFWKFEQVTWEANGLPAEDFTVSLIKDGVTLADHHPDFDRGEFNWLVGELTLGDTAEPDNGYKIRIGIAGTDDVAESGTFDVIGIHIDSPAPDECWKPGNTRNITWKCNEVGNNLDITLKKRGALLGTIAAGVSPGTCPNCPGLGSYSWNVGSYTDGSGDPHNAAPGYAYTIEIKENFGADPISYETESFILKGITFLSPIGGEKWRLGSTQTITWEAICITNQVKIMLYKDGSYQGDITDNIDASAGQCTWNAAGTLVGGTEAYPDDGYTIRIQENGTTDVYESGPFDLTGIRVTAPILGACRTPGTYENITWICDGVNNNVNIILKKSGVFLGNIATGVSPGCPAGSYSWDSESHSGGTALPGYDYTIEIIEDTAFNPFSHESNPFKLKGIHILSPDGGEIWQKRTIRRISWDGPCVTHKIKIMLYRNGSYYGDISGIFYGNEGYYDWYAGKLHDEETLVPPANDYQIRITSVDGDDMSDGYFTLDE